MAQSFQIRLTRDAGATRAQPTAPRWERSASEMLRHAAARVQLIGRATPTNFAEELGSLRDAFAAGQPRSPRFGYAPAPPSDELGQALCRAADDLAALDDLGALYAARARELALELRMCASVGEADYFELARRRYGARDAHDAGADAMAERWLQNRDEALAGDAAIEVVSDDEADGRSLVSRLRQEVGERRLPFRVVVSPQLAALAATGPSILYVAHGRVMSVGDVERTVLHELEGHAMPRSRARQARLGIFCLGTAHGSDDQEGRALCIEQRAGMLLGPRRRELARRHLAGRSVESGASFVETVERLRHADAPLETALRIAARSHRAGGMARELVYLPAMLRVAAMLERDPGIDRVLGSGQVSTDAAEVLRDWLP